MKNKKLSLCIINPLNIKCYQNICVREQKSEPGIPLPRRQRIQWFIFKLWFSVFFYIQDLILLVKRRLSAMDRIRALFFRTLIFTMFCFVLSLSSP